jgi:peptide/nickel transport system permease protein
MTALTLRGWLLAEVPSSKTQARCQRLFIGWLAFKGNPVAMIGLLIIASLVGVALLAPWITASDALEPDLLVRYR